MPHATLTSSLDLTLILLMRHSNPQLSSSVLRGGIELVAVGADRIDQGCGLLFAATLLAGEVSNLLGFAVLPTVGGARLGFASSSFCHSRAGTTLNL